MPKIKIVLLLILLTFTSCGHYIDINNLEQRQHGLSYLKGTNTLANGEAVRKTSGGKIVELHTYKEGKMIGNWFQYGEKGQVTSHGFGTEINNYENIINGTDLAYCILSIVEIKEDFSYATLYMDNKNFFSDKEKILKLSKAIFSDYSDKYKISDLLIFDNAHEYSVSKTATINTYYTIDTITKTTHEKLRFH